MEKYKLKLTILNDKDEPQISSIVTSECLEELQEYHNINALDQQLNLMLEELKKNNS